MVGSLPLNIQHNHLLKSKRREAAATVRRGWRRLKGRPSQQRRSGTRWACPLAAHTRWRGAQSWAAEPGGVHSVILLSIPCFSYYYYFLITTSKTPLKISKMKKRLYVGELQDTLHLQLCLIYYKNSRLTEPNSSLCAKMLRLRAREKGDLQAVNTVWVRRSKEMFLLLKREHFLKNMNIL